MPSTVGFLIPCKTSLGHTIYHAMPTRPYHITSPYLARPLRYTMSCPTDHASYHAMPTRPHHMSWHNRQTIPYTMPCLPGHTIYMSSCQATPYAIPYLARQYPLPCHARKDIPYTMPGPPSNNIYHAMHKPCHVRKAISYNMPCFPGLTIYHARPSKPYHIPCHTR